MKTVAKRKQLTAELIQLEKRMNVVRHNLWALTNTEKLRKYKREWTRASRAKKKLAIKKQRRQKRGNKK